MVKIGIVQMRTCENKEENLKTVEKGIKNCINKGGEIIILPEIFNSLYETKKFGEYSESKNGKTYTFLSNISKENKIILIGGSIPENDSEIIYNTCFIFDEKGNQISFHRKINLFDIDIKNGKYFKESESLTSVNSICVFNTKFCKIGVCNYFDMRFPELPRLMVQRGAEIIVVLGAFNMITSPTHWDIMFQQRAVDNQCFTIGMAPTRNANLSYFSYANSIVVNPWGTIIYHSKEKECFDVVDINLNEVQKIRKELPLLSARRNDIYILKENNNEIKNGFKIAEEKNVYEIYYILDKTREKLNKKGINQWKEGWDINNLKLKCKMGSIYALLNEGNLIGCFCIEKNLDIIWIEEENASYLSMICLHPDYQGKGLGKQLIKYALENSTNIVYLDCWSGNDKLKSFYIENGFKYLKDIKENTYMISIFKKE